MSKGEEDVRTNETATNQLRAHRSELSVGFGAHIMAIESGQHEAKRGWSLVMRRFVPQLTSYFATAPSPPKRHDLQMPKPLPLA